MSTDDCIEATLNEIEAKEAALRGPLKRFAAICETRLRKHDSSRGKRGWEGDKVSWLMDRLMEELQEATEEWMGERNHDEVMRFLFHNLRQRTRGFYCKPDQYDVKKLTHELSDIANFCMMIADVAGGLDE
jgi:NTP pyrophosphatase (non-canonical NTP hydrolase)